MFCVIVSEDDTNKEKVVCPCCALSLSKVSLARKCVQSRALKVRSERVRIKYAKNCVLALEIGLNFRVNETRWRKIVG